MTDQTRKWMNILDEWGTQKIVEKYKCPHCGQRFKSRGGAQGHWAVSHKKHGKTKPTYETVRNVKKKMSRKHQLKQAQKKSTTVKKRPHRDIDECKKMIVDYEKSLRMMTAAEYQEKTGISKQMIHRMRSKIKESESKKS